MLGRESMKETPQRSTAGCCLIGVPALVMNRKVRCFGVSCKCTCAVFSVAFDTRGCSIFLNCLCLGIAKGYMCRDGVFGKFNLKVLCVCVCVFMLNVCAGKKMKTKEAHDIQ